MKTSILKAFVLPVAAFALASAGAVSTSTAKESKADVAVRAYIHNPAMPDGCEEVFDTNCDPGTGPTCLSGANITAYGKDLDGSCNVQLHRN
jgi:hypothetical protein